MKISLALGTYNGERYLLEQLESLARQTRLPDELIICDDGSSDATEAITEAFARRANFPVLIQPSAGHIGQHKTYERAYRVCSGDVMLQCDQDDIWLPNKLQVIEQTFLDHPEMDALFSDAELIDKSSAPIGQTLFQWIGFAPTRQAHYASGTYKPDLVLKNPAWGTTIAFRSRWRSLILPMEASGSHPDDWVFSLIGFAGCAGIIPEVLLKYRQHDSNATGVRSNGRNSVRKFTSKLFQHNRVKRYQRSIDRLTPMVTRLKQADPTNGLRESLTLIEARLAYATHHRDMSDNIAVRTAQAAREFAAGQYARSGSGWPEFVADVLDR